MKHSIGIMMMLGLAMVGSALAQQSAGTQQAVRWERAKNAAAARQTRAEASHAAKPAQTTVAPKAGDGSTQDTGRWERAKDAAAVRQARIDAKSGNTADAPPAAKTKKK
jgi:hypothetical protein